MTFIFLFLCPGAQTEEAAPAIPADEPVFPDHVTYLLIGAGTASFAALRAIRANDATAKVRQRKQKCFLFSTFFNF